MKYILIIIAAMFFAQPVLAARLANGAVPSVAPLQPLPTGIAPNVQHNVQLQSNFNPGAGAPASQAQPPAASAAGQQAPAQAAAAVVPQYKKSSAWIWWLIIILAALALGFFLKRKGPTL